MTLISRQLPPFFGVSVLFFLFRFVWFVSDFLGEKESVLIVSADVSSKIVIGVLLSIGWKSTLPWRRRRRL